MLKVGIVANEASGDILGASLMRALKARNPEIRFTGVGGPEMTAAGIESLFPMERLSVMGLIEVIKHLPRLFAMRRQLVDHFIAQPPDIFIGIDAPDFNLGLERKLKSSGIPTVHYVCPTVWAWRPKRVKKIRAAADTVLCLFPFEAGFLQPHGIRAVFTGHPLADEIALDIDQQAARTELALDPENPVLAILPGSRMSEVEALSAVFIESARLCHARNPDLQLIVPMVNQRLKRRFQAILREVAPGLPVSLTDGASRKVLAAADWVLTASGTATLEALLHKRPMVVAYILNRFTYWIVNTFKLVKIPHIAIANLLSDSALAAEFLQQQVTPESLSGALVELMESDQKCAEISSHYRQLHQQLRQDAGHRAAQAVLELVHNDAA